MAMAKDQRPPGADVIQVAIAVEVENVRPVTALDERRLPADCTERPRRAIDAAGNDSAGALEGLSAACSRGFHAVIIRAMAHVAPSLKSLQSLHPPALAKSFLLGYSQYLACRRVLVE